MYRFWKGLQKISLRGSFTVEASYLLPLIVFLIWNVLYLSFFLYDQSTILQGSYCTALRTERLHGTEEEKRAAAEEKYQDCVRSRIVYGELQEEKTITTGAVTIGTKLTMHAPAGGFLQSSWYGEQLQTAEKWEPVAFIRNCRKAENIWNILQAGDG